MPSLPPASAHPSRRTGLVPLLTGLLIVPLTALVVLTAQGAPVYAASARSGSSDAQAYAATAHAATNAQRAGAGLARLQQDGCLRRAATRQARAMAAAGTLSHQDLGAVLARCGLRATAENVAAGYPRGRSAVRGWMGSPGHRANLLAPAYRLEGIGAVRDAQGRWWVAQVFGTRA